MIMETIDTSNMEYKAAKDANNPKVKEWETLMDKFQQVSPWAKKDEKWVMMNKIFQL